MTPLVLSQTSRVWGLRPASAAGFNSFSPCAAWYPWISFTSSLRMKVIVSAVITWPGRDFEDVLAKLNSYSSAASVMLQRKGRKGGLTQAVLHGLWSFIRTYFLRMGFLDGREGFMLAVMNAENSYYRYIKLWLKQKS